MSIQVRVRTLRTAPDLVGKRPYAAQLLPDGDLHFAKASPGKGGEDVFQLVAFPGDILDCRICGLDQASGRVNAAQFQGVLMSPNGHSSRAEERLGLIRFSNSFWEEFEPFFSSGWRVTKAFWNEAGQLSWPVELPPGLQGALNSSGRYFLAENKHSYRLFHDGRSVAETDWIVAHLEVQESQEMSPYTKTLVAQLKAARTNDSRLPGEGN